MRRIGLGDDQHATRIAIEAMHNARASWSTRAAELLKMKRESRGQRPAPVTFRGMHDHRGRLVDGREMFIFEKNLQRNIFGNWSLPRHFRDRDRKPLAAF